LFRQLLPVRDDRLDLFPVKRPRTDRAESHRGIGCGLHRTGYSHPTGHHRVHRISRAHPLRGLPNNGAVPALLRHHSLTPTRCHQNGHESNGLPTPSQSVPRSKPGINTLSSAKVSSTFTCRTPIMPAATAPATFRGESSTNTHSSTATPSRSQINRYTATSGLATPTSPENTKTSKRPPRPRRASEPPAAFDNNAVRTPRVRAHRTASSNRHPPTSVSTPAWSRTNPRTIPQPYAHTSTPQPNRRPEIEINHPVKSYLSETRI